MQIVFAANFDTELDDIVTFSRVFYYYDEARVEAFVGALYEDIFLKLENPFLHGTRVNSVRYGGIVQSLPVQRVFRIFFTEADSIRTVLAIRAMRAIQ